MVVTVIIRIHKYTEVFGALEAIKAVCSTLLFYVFYVLTTEGKPKYNDIFIKMAAANHHDSNSWKYLTRASMHNGN